MAMESISDLETQEACKKFLLTLKDLERQLKAIKEESSLLKVPRVPHLEGVHASIDHCRVSSLDHCRVRGLDHCLVSSLDHCQVRDLDYCQRRVVPA